MRKVYKYTFVGDMPRNHHLQMLEHELKQCVVGKNCHILSEDLVVGGLVMVKVVVFHARQIVSTGQTIGMAVTSSPPISSQIIDLEKKLRMKKVGE